MKASSYEIRLCQNPDCGLRYPLTKGQPVVVRCPACLGDTQVVRHGVISREVPREGDKLPENIKLLVLLDNIRSAWNVGSIFRTADGLGIPKLYLCGITPTPEYEPVRKTSLGAEEALDWEYARNALKTVKKLKAEGYKLIALEQDERALPVTDPHFNTQPSVLILGNEVTGVDLEILDVCDQILYVPMQGSKRSYNVEVAFAIAAFQLLHGQAQD